MRACLFLLILISFSALGQQTDTLRVKDKVKSKWNRVDSVNTETNAKIDSVQSVFNQGLNPNAGNIIKKIKSKRKKKPAQDTTSADYKHKLDSAINNLSVRDKVKAGDAYTHKLDSIKNLNISADQYLKLPDSLKQNKALNEVKNAQSKVTGVEQNLNEKINSPAKKIEDKATEGMNRLSKEANGEGNLPANVNLPSANTSITDGALSKTGTSDLKLPDVNSSIDKNSSNLNTDLSTDKLQDKVSNPLEGKLKSETDKLDVKEKMSKVTDSKALNEVKDKGADLNSATDKAQGYTQDVKNIKNGDFDKAETLKKDIAFKVPMKEVSGAQDQLSQGTKGLEKLKALKNKEEFKKQTIARARETVVKQITTQHTKMMEPVNKISTYQKKAGSAFASVKDLPNRPRKAKKPPLIERFVPGVTVQVQKGRSWLIDINPTLRFRVRSILSTGLGYNYRLPIDPHGKYQAAQSISGFRNFTEFSIRKGLSLRADVERMNSFVPLQFAQPDIGRRKYVWSFMAGVRKDFSLSAHVLGNVQFMYNIYDPHKESPYLSRFNVRFGFDFPLKKKLNQSEGAN